MTRIKLEVTICDRFNRYIEGAENCDRLNVIFRKKYYILVQENYLTGNKVINKGIRGAHPIFSEAVNC